MFGTGMKFLGRIESPGSIEERLGIIMPFIASFQWANNEQKSRLCTMSLLWAQIDPNDFNPQYVERTNYEFVAYIRKIGLFRTPLVAVQTANYDPVLPASRAPKLVVQFEILLDPGPDAERTQRRFEQNPPDNLSTAACSRLTAFHLNLESAEKWARVVLSWADPLKSGFIRGELGEAEDRLKQALLNSSTRDYVLGQNLWHSSILNPYPGIPEYLFTSQIFDDAEAD